MALPPLKGTGKTESQSGSAKAQQGQVSNMATELTETDRGDLNIDLEDMIR